MEWTDQQAAEEARNGNQAAFRVLVERHSRPLFRLAFRMTSNEQDAEDLVQETFLRAYKQIHRFDGRASVGTWLYRIATNCTLDLLRSRRSRKEQQATGADEETANRLDNAESPAPSPERLTASSQIAGLLAPALQQLSGAERTAFLLRHYEGRGIDEIAEVLGVSAGAAKHSVFRSVQKLRRALEPVWGGVR
jgi:RNA polymerase sigma-70 factor (ECF subfamily)